MDIEERDYCPDNTYFRTGDVEPDVKGDTLVIYSGEGERRGWGRPGNHTYVVYNDYRLTSVVVGFYHKHGGGQFWRHYVDGQQKTWSQLHEEDQSAILEAAEKDAPSFANVPGILKSKKARPLNKIERENCIGYKDLIITRQNGEIVSIKSPQQGTPWSFDGCQWTCEAHELPDEHNHSGVYVAYNAPTARSYAGELCKVILSGTVVVGDKGARGSFARLLEVL